MLISTLKHALVILGPHVRYVAMMGITLTVPLPTIKGVLSMRPLTLSTGAHHLSVNVSKEINLMT